MVKTETQPVEYWINKCEEQAKLIEVLKQQILLMNHRQFGKKSEKREIEGQLFLFNEAEACADLDVPEPEIETITYDRKKQKGKREEDLSGLPVEKIIYELPEDERQCPVHNETMGVIGHEIRREVKIIPPQFTVIEHAREIYGCAPCGKANLPVPIVKAPIPEPVIKNSFASPSAVAHVMAQKFVNAMPLYRQEQDFLRNGFVLSRQTMANWMIKCADDWLRPVYNRFKKLFLERDVGHVDETTMQVLKEPGKAPETKSYMWMYRTSGDTDRHIVIFEYQPNRNHEHPKIFLKEYSGYIHTDGYEAYHKLPENIIVSGCWAHLRRRWDDASKVVPKEKRKESNSYKGLAYCQSLFILEQKYDEQKLNKDERQEQRLKHSLPIAKDFFEWAKTINPLPGTALGKAVTYMFNQQTYLMNFFLDGRLELSNNRGENSMRPLTLGRKNWLFACTVDGAEASAIIYSIVQTAIENGLNPFKYLEYLFEQLPNSNDPVDTFLPWNEKVFEICKMPAKGKESDNGKNKH